jgi:replication factor A1
MEVNGRVCNKKVINNGDGTWQCDKCDKSLPNCEYRYLLQCQIQDHTGVTYATAFQEAGIEIVGHSAHELYNIREEDPERFAEILQGVRWQQFLFKLKVKEETFNDEQRVKCSIMRAEKLDPARQSMLASSNANLQLDRASYSSSTSSNVGATGFAQSNWMHSTISFIRRSCFLWWLWLFGSVGSEGSLLQMQPAWALV